MSFINSFVNSSVHLNVCTRWCDNKYVKYAFTLLRVLWSQIHESVDHKLHAGASKVHVPMFNNMNLIPITLQT